MFIGKYKNDYKGSGNEYVGSYYTLPFDKSEKTASGITNLAFAVFFAIAFLVMGMINQPSSRTLYVVLPYMFLFLPTMYFFFGAVRYFNSPVRMQRVDYKKGLVRMKNAARGLLILLGMNVILDIMFIFTHIGLYPMGREVVYLATHFVFAGLVIAYGVLYDRFYKGVQADIN